MFKFMCCYVMICSDLTFLSFHRKKSVRKNIKMYLMFIHVFPMACVDNVMFVIKVLSVRLIVFST